MRDLFRFLPLDELISVLYAVAVRVALRGLLTIVDVVAIRSVTDDPDKLDQAA